MPDNEGQAVPLARALRGMAGHVVALLQVRLELLGVEAREAIDHVAELLAWLVVALVALSLGTVFVAVFITVALWDSHRLLALAAFATLFLTLGGVAAWMLRRCVRRTPALFQASAAELKRDRDQLTP